MFAQTFLYAGSGTPVWEANTTQLPAPFNLAAVERILSKVIVLNTDVAFDVGPGGAVTITANRNGQPLFEPILIANE